MNYDLGTFLLSVLASFIGAIPGVWVAFRVDRWWEKRQRKKLALDTGQGIAEEFGNNITTLRTIIDVLTAMPTELAGGGLGERWFNPFARMKMAAVRQAIEHDLFDLMREKEKEGFELQVEWDLENREGINVLLSKFEDDLRDFEAKKIDSAILQNRQRRLVDELNRYLQSTMEAYNRFKTSTGLHSFAETWGKNSSMETN